MRTVSFALLDQILSVFFFAVKNALLSITGVLVGSVSVDFKDIKWFKEV